MLTLPIMPPHLAAIVDARCAQLERALVQLQLPARDDLATRRGRDQLDALLASTQAEVHAHRVARLQHAIRGLRLVAGLARDAPPEVPLMVTVNDLISLGLARPPTAFADEGIETEE